MGRQGPAQRAEGASASASVAALHIELLCSTEPHPPTHPPITDDGVCAHRAAGLAARSGGGGAINRRPHRRAPGGGGGRDASESCARARGSRNFDTVPARDRPKRAHGARGARRVARPPGGREEGRGGAGRASSAGLRGWTHVTRRWQASHRVGAIVVVSASARTPRVLLRHAGAGVAGAENNGRRRCLDGAGGRADRQASVRGR